MSLINCGCGKTIATKPEWAGIQIRCAGCGRSHSIHAGAPPTPPPAEIVVDAPDTKACPRCAGRIKAAAIKCRLCGHMLSEAPARVAPVSATPGIDAGGIGVLVVGLLSWIVFCCLTSPLAWIMGSLYEADCRRRGTRPSGAGRAGKVLGIIGTLLVLLSIVVFVLVLASGTS